MSQTLARVRAMAEYEGHADKDDVSRGYCESLDVRHDEHARELILRAQAWAWTPERLEGFLMGHEQFARNARCTCECPVHGDGERSIDSDSN